MTFFVIAQPNRTGTAGTMLFNTSIMNNILYGRLDATEEEVVAAAKAANAHEFIKDLPDGYATVVGDRGSALSGRTASTNRHCQSYF